MVMVFVVISGIVSIFILLSFLTKKYNRMRSYEVANIIERFMEGKVSEWIKIRKSDFEEINHTGRRFLKKKELINILKLAKKIPPYKILEFTLRPEGLYFWQIIEDKTSKKLE